MSAGSSSEATARHAFRRVRFESRRRSLTVTHVESLTPRFLRIHFGGEDLKDFSSASHDDHIKIFFPNEPNENGGKLWMRDFTPRRFDPERKSLVVDFALHTAGPATEWASQAQAGQSLQIGGPRGSVVASDDFDWILLVGDETAFPAIARRLEEARPGLRVISAMIASDARERHPIDTKADWEAIWTFRSDADAADAVLLRQALDRLDWPAGDGLAWIAAEASVARAMRIYVTEERRHPKAWIKAAGYWKSGEAAAHERIED